jgi:protein tyrosine phosphatase (PTP) superfamily phosphohydrolase (DUF442 family)
MSTDEIYNYVKVSDPLITGGQPTADQLRDAAAEGFLAVINLATTNPPHSLDGEGELVESLGLEYIHIPVDWNNPTDADFTAFETAMNRLADAKILIHCAANYRVTAFYSLYARMHLGWNEEEAAAFRARIWAGSDYPVWEEFIARYNM